MTKVTHFCHYVEELSMFVDNMSDSGQVFVLGKSSSTAGLIWYCYLNELTVMADVDFLFF